MISRPTTLARSIIPLLLAVTGVTAVDAPSAGAAALTVDYVALGDSYSSGVGTPDMSGTCGRSNSGYPALWATNHRNTSFTFAACGGATTDDVLRTQISSLNGGTDLVSITIGGNDVGFFPTVLSCWSGTDAACEQRVSTARTGISQMLPAKLDATYAAIRRQAPFAAVVVLGYPRLFDPTGDCPGDGMTTYKRRVLNAAADHLARVIADRAQAAGFTAADVRATFDGHGVCTAATWINNLSSTRPSDSFHPNAAGYAQGYLPVLSAATDAA